jgi:UDP-N-acetylmuramate dehydrogenase
MNAGAFGGEMADIVDKVLVYDRGKLKILQGGELCFSYRSSVFKTSGKIILASILKGKKEDEKVIKKKISENKKKRNETQPKGISLGSTFLKNNQISAAVYIDKAGLKGYTVGGAKISDKHANFIINENNASSKDFLDLVSLIQSTVKEKFDVDLKLEIEVL